MLEIIKQVKADAERELTLAQAKVEVANAILARCEALSQIVEEATPEETATEYADTEAEYSEIVTEVQ